MLSASMLNVVMAVCRGVDFAFTEAAPEKKKTHQLTAKSDQH
jgi:hypothetical protein